MDLVQTFPLYRGKGSHDPNEEAGMAVGCFKGSVKMYPLPDDGSPEPERILANIPSTDPIEVVVRVYIIKVGVVHIWQTTCAHFKMPTFLVSPFHRA